MQWIEVCIKTTSQAIELVGERLTMLGFDSFIMDDQDEFHEFLENNKQYWDYVDEGLEKQMQGLSQIRLYLEDSPAAPETISYLKDQLRLLPQQYPSIEFGTLDVSLEHVKDEDWENNWKQYYQPLKIGSKLLVVPEWLHPENPEHRVEVLLDPGMIFGTGAHASTQMCMEELERAIQGGEEVLDLGSGSGILSITALLLGAEHATGVDIDPKAEDIARQNAAINQLGSDRFTALTGDVIGDKAMMEKRQLEQLLFDAGFVHGASLLFIFSILHNPSACRQAPGYWKERAKMRPARCVDARRMIACYCTAIKNVVY